MDKKKKLLLLLALLAVVLFLTLRNEPGSQPDNQPETAETPVAVGETEVAILSVNDIHASIDMFPKFATVVDSLKTIYPGLLVFSAGDNRTGNPVNDQYKPTNYPVIELMNRTGFNLSAVGNHEWDGNIDNLQHDMERANFPFLCANVFVPDDVKLDVRPYEIVESQGVKLAVVGMIELRSDGLPGAHPDNFKKVSFKRSEKVLPDYQYLKQQSNAFILLSHCGFEDDMALAEAFPWIDVIIGGHSHTLIERPAETNGVLITQSGSHLKNATLVKLRFRDGKLTKKTAKVLNINAKRREKPEIKKIVDEFNDTPSLNAAIATAKTRLENREEIGCMVTDALREGSGADFAFQNTGGIRVNYLKKGPITVKDVYSIDPFDNEVVVFQMTGDQVKKFIVNSYKKNGGYPSHVSGMTYEVHDNGQNISVFVNPEKGAFSKNAVYKVAINSYMASTVRIESLDDGQSLFKTSAEMVVDFLRRHKTIDYQGVVRAK